MSDTVKVIVDYFYASPKKRPSIDTGDWELIYESEAIVEKPITSFGVEFLCAGTKMKVKRPKR